VDRCLVGGRIKTGHRGSTTARKAI
jgi:hypothetical protein